MKNNKQQYTFIDLFAGLGGFHLALQQLGGKCVFASEIKDDLRKLYALNFPETPIYGDITKINPEDIPPHDIVCAGFPCQPFSQAGKREGFNDTKQRGTLFDYICAIVAEHRPKYLLLENVQNLKNHDNGNTWKVIQEKLAALNYDVKADILSPHQFGLPQHRKRIFIVAIANEKGSLDHFRFPVAQKGASRFCDINKVIDASDTNITKLKPEQGFNLKFGKSSLTKLSRTAILYRHSLYGPWNLEPHMISKIKPLYSNLLKICKAS